MRCVLITGANSGLGYYAAQNIAAAGHRVLLACRSVAKAEEAASKIAQSLDMATDTIVPVNCPLDLANFESVRKFAQKVETPDVLVNNAAVFHQGQLTDSEYFRINAWSPVLLTDLL